MQINSINTNNIPQKHVSSPGFKGYSRVQLDNAIKFRRKNSIIKSAYNILRLLNTKNYKLFINIIISAVLAGNLRRIFNSADPLSKQVTDILKNPNLKSKIIEEYNEAADKEELYSPAGDLKLDEQTPYIASKIEQLVTPKNKTAFAKIINNKLLEDEDLVGYLMCVSNYSEAEKENLFKNLDTGLGDYLKSIAADNRHPLRKNLNTMDFAQNGSDFVYLVNNLMNNNIALMNLLKYPFESKKHFNTALRDVGSLMGTIYRNERALVLDNPNKISDLKYFFSISFPSIIGMTALTDKETVLQLFDRGFEQVQYYTMALKKMSSNDEKLINTVVRKGKKINKLGAEVNIPAKDKVYMYKLIALNNLKYAALLEKIDLNSAISASKNNSGVYIDFNKIGQQIKQCVLSRCGFSTEEIQNLAPENMDWDILNIHLLSRVSIDDALKTIVKSASEGKFNELINDPFNKYGYANMKTQEAFKEAGLDYDVWTNGIEAEEFEINGEKYTISIWKRRPQESIFNGNYTSCCTGIGEAQGASMPYYLLNTMFNVAEVKNEKGETIAQSRMFLIDKDYPILIIDNVEVNNNFKKKLVTYKQKQDFMEKIFSYERKFAQKLARRNISLFYSRENNKLLPREQLNYPKVQWYIRSTVGELSDENVYCNIITSSFRNLIKSFVIPYDITEPPKETSF